MEWCTKPLAKRLGMIDPFIPSERQSIGAAPNGFRRSSTGYRLIARKRGGRRRLFTRNGSTESGRRSREQPRRGVSSSVNGGLTSKSVLVRRRKATSWSVRSMK
jgi:hypothetical protein